MSARILNAQGILSSDVPTGNLLWVDAVNGVDALATRGRMTIPFKTLVAAKNAAGNIPGVADTIIVLPGTHYTDQQLAKSGVNWHATNGAVIMGTATNTPLFLINAQMAFQVTGAGVFVLSQGTHVLEVTHSLADVYFQARQLLGLQSAIKVTTTGARATVEADLISGEDSSAIDVSNGTLRVKAREIFSNSLHGVNMSGGTADIDAFQIKSLGGKGIYFSAGTARIRAFEILATTAPAVEYTYGGTLTIQNARLVSTYNSSTGRAVYASGGSSGITLHSCVLISHSSASESIDAAGAFTVQFHGMCTANKAKGTNISGPTLSTSPGGFNVGSQGIIT
jgi:hypothetical protein